MWKKKIYIFSWERAPHLALCLFLICGDPGQAACLYESKYYLEASRCFPKELLAVEPWLKTMFQQLKKMLLKYTLCPRHNTHILFEKISLLQKTMLMNQHLSCLYHSTLQKASQQGQEIQVALGVCCLDRWKFFVIGKVFTLSLNSLFSPRSVTLSLSSAWNLDLCLFTFSFWNIFLPSIGRNNLYKLLEYYTTYSCLYSVQFRFAADFKGVFVVLGFALVL